MKPKGNIRALLALQEYPVAVFVNNVLHLPHGQLFFFREGLKTYTINKSALQDSAVSLTMDVLVYNR